MHARSNIDWWRFVVAKYFVPDGKGGFVQKGGSESGVYFVPDGKGGFVQKGGSNNEPTIFPDGGNVSQNTDAMSCLVILLPVLIPFGVPITLFSVVSSQVVFAFVLSYLFLLVMPSSLFVGFVSISIPLMISALFLAVWYWTLYPKCNKLYKMQFWVVLAGVLLTPIICFIFLLFSLV